ncbi:hypothetical protein CLOBOL_04347 [Enterocloster bolteae ATCC BAA-613]|uniref:Uncharacterized protein n=1 Tax=Enterocloster bolteae (strain ATCC BAA-613 / DSM 15670 / CCUG 46953 / JCM 12243 / WAL 16351) TaxID=411902 RepID=A8RVQ5_ENTBW|nr:hypothetical protein CLOBOL_04347 [Enterocloster bolteae ATCC BAA-613]
MCDGHVGYDGVLGIPLLLSQSCGMYVKSSVQPCG